jgi:hypothetical protein
MHSTLKIRTNIMLICIWALVVFACFYLGKSPNLSIIFSFLAIGLFTGIFQSLAIRSTPQLFLASHTAMDVRKASLSSTFGKLSIATLWVAVPLLLWLVWFKPELISPFQTIIGSYATMALTREVASFPGVLFLAGYKNVAN